LKWLPLPSAEEDKAMEIIPGHVGGRGLQEYMHLLQLRLLLLSY